MNVITKNINFFMSRLLINFYYFLERELDLELLLDLDPLLDLDDLLDLLTDPLDLLLEEDLLIDPLLLLELLLGEDTFGLALLVVLDRVVLLGLVERLLLL